ncbi:MAG TPA: hypothetical protein VK857_01595, partial [Desulforhopalus sp.]|nr:hypothetical protein [Desulforhopalus sp.]
MKGEYQSAVLRSRRGRRSCSGLILDLVLFVAGPTPAECLQGNCRDGVGSFVAADGRRYEGEFKNGLIDGQGRLTFVDGTVYVGELRDG